MSLTNAEQRIIVASVTWPFVQLLGIRAHQVQPAKSMRATSSALQEIIGDLIFQPEIIEQ